MGERFNHPPPAEMPILVEGPSCAAAFPDLHSPVVAVGRNCEHKCDCGRNDHSAQNPNQKCPYHFSLNIAVIGLLLPRRVRQILLCHSGAILCSLFRATVFPTLPFTKDPSAPPSRFLAPATDGRSFDVQTLNAQVWLNFRRLKKV
jgi:hypothetical protein